jgi:hypothetical protein
MSGFAQILVEYKELLELPRSVYFLESGRVVNCFRPLSVAVPLGIASLPLPHGGVLECHTLPALLRRFRETRARIFGGGVTASLDRLMSHPERA